MANKQVLFCGTDERYLAKEFIKDANDANSNAAFRIPSIVNANGTLIAAIDKAATGMDWGYIELAIRRSADGGKSWTNIQTIATPPARQINSDKENTATAFYIDPCMAVAPNGDVILLATYFPESKGLFNKNMLDKNKTAYSLFNGEMCPLIYDRDGNYFYILKDGKVIDSNKKPTEFRCCFTDGELYKGDEYIGNIFLNGAIGKSDNDTKTTYGAPLKAVRRSYIFMLRSTDQGATWSNPIDITSSILGTKPEGPFMGIAPGNAPTLKNGRMVFPLYTIKGTVCIYSDDNGETWRRNQNIQYTPNIDEWTISELSNGQLISFSRSKVAGKIPSCISSDGGITWINTKKVPKKAPKCQKNSIVIGDKIFISHPSGSKRENGVISVGSIEYDKKNQLKAIKWQKEDIEINKSFFAYSCMAQIDENTIGILYEDQPGSHIIFETISI